MGNELRAATGLLQGVACVVGLDRGDDAGITRLAEELSAALNVKELDAFEMVLCRQELPFWDTVFVAAGGAGFRSVAQVVNTSSVNEAHLIVIDAAAGSLSGAGVSVGFSRTTTLATTDSGALASRDGRFSRGVIPFTRMRTQNNAALPAGFTNGLSWEEDALTSTSVRLPVKVVLPPQESLAIFPGADNMAIRASFAGRVYRVARSRELNP